MAAADALFFHAARIFYEGVFDDFLRQAVSIYLKDFIIIEGQPQYAFPLRRDVYKRPRTAPSLLR